MDFKQLQFLCALEKTRHFGAAAKECCVTQPTLSMRIQALEEELGLRLIHRGHRFEGFTAEGLQVLSRAKELLAIQGTMKAEATAFKGQLVGRGCLGQVPLSTLDPIPILDELHKRHPQLSMSIINHHNDALLDALLDNSLDAAIVYDEGINDQAFVFQKLHQRGFELAFNPEKNADLLKQGPLKWQELTGLPLGVLNATHLFRRHLDNILTAESVSISTFLETDSVGLMMTAVEQGVCCAVIPEKYPHYNHDCVQTRSLGSTQGNSVLPALGVAIKRLTPLLPIGALLAEMLVEVS